jgi:hypothetical protein
VRATWKVELRDQTSAKHEAGGWNTVVNGSVELGRVAEAVIDIVYTVSIAKEAK